MDNDLSRRHFLKLGAAGVTGVSLAAWESQAADFHPPQGKMSTRVLGKTGVTVSILGLGGQSAVTDFPNDELAAKFINNCIDAGINYLDTAPLYGQANDPRNSERRYGKALAHRRGDVYLATKTPKRRADEAMRDIETSLKLLQTDHIDCLQIHSLDPKEDLASFGKPNGVYTLLRKLRDQKVIRFIGVTSHQGAVVLKNAIEMYEFDTVLTTFNPTKERRACEELFLPVARRQRLGIIAMKTMGGASRYDNVGITGVPGNLVGEGHDRTTPENLLRYALSLPLHTAICGLRDYRQLQQDLAVCYNFQPLKEHERTSLQFALNNSDRFLAYNKPSYAGA